MGKGKKEMKKGHGMNTEKSKEKQEDREIKNETRKRKKKDFPLVFIGTCFPRRRLVIQ